MRMNKIYRCLLLIVSAFIFYGCEGYFGKKTNLSFIEIPKATNTIVAYVPVQPFIPGFVYPTDIIIGYDQLIYVADSGTGKITCYDLSWRQLGTYAVPGLSTMAQDRELDLLVVGTFDTLISNINYTLSCIYRIELKNAIYGFEQAYIKKKIIHPFYFKEGISSDDALVRIKNVAVLGDNSYYVTRTGPDNSATQFGGPDDAVLYFDKNDNFVSPVGVSTPIGYYSNFFQSPIGIASLAQPPQSTTVSSSGDFIFTCNSPNFTYKALYIQQVVSNQGEVYQVEGFYSDTTQAIGFLYTPYRFVDPVDVTVSGDGTNYIFIVDAAKDSLYQFTTTGLEGVTPPPALHQTKHIKVSFGGKGTGLSQFNNPRAVAYYQKIVYVADAGNGRILRFELTTDINQN